MASPFADLIIQDVAVHEVLQRDIDLQPVPPRYSTRLADLGKDGLMALRDRVSKAMSSDSKSVEMRISDQSERSAFAFACEAITSSPEQFLEISRTITAKLADAQSARNIPGGIVVVMRGTVGMGEKRRKFVGVIKAEMHAGFAKDGREGEPTIRYLTELLLTPHQKLHKIGMFICDGVPQESPKDTMLEDFTTYVFDSYMGGAEITTAANYFYERFLGCAAASSARKLTRDFYNASKEFINSAIGDDEQKVAAVSALHVYLRSNSELIHPPDFAKEHFPSDLVQSYIDHLDQNNVPARAITKDTSAIKHHLRIRRLNFTNDIRILGPAERFSELVSIAERSPEGTMVMIRGALTGQQ